MSKSTPQAGWDALAYAVWADQVAVVRELLDGGADPNGAVGGKTPLMEVVDEPERFFDAGRLEMTVRLVEPQLVAGCPASAVKDIVLQQREERFHRGSPRRHRPGHMDPTRPLLASTRTY
jgi:hypothetical protein